MHRLCRRCHCHRAGEQGTGDDAEASLSALSLPSTCTSIHRCRFHRHRAGERGTDNDAEASLPALSPSSLRYVVCSAADVAIARASEGQVMMPRHHRPTCHRCRRARASVRRCHHHRHCHRAGERGTGDDAKASSPALSLSLTRTILRLNII